MKIMFDAQKCTLCGSCMDACAAKNGAARLAISKDEDGKIVRSQCHQCAKPQCAYACTYELIYRNKQTRALQVYEDECQACHACVYACPFGAVLTHPKAGIAWICDLCQGDPQCVKACPAGALTLVD